MKMLKKFMVCMGILAGIGMTIQMTGTTINANSINREESGNKETSNKEASNKVEKTPKYIFTFIGDGMSYPQINAAQIYTGVKNNPNSIELDKLGFDQFPSVGMMTTQDSTSFAPDSASTATSMATGFKTHSGVIGLKSDKSTELTTVAEKLKMEGYKVGIVSTVTLNHATPAAYYANTVSRNNYYDIALQMAESDFDYFGGGELNKADGQNGGEESAYDVMKKNGYTITNNKEEIMSLNDKSGKVYAISPKLDGGAMPYDIDMNADDLRLKDFVKKGIDVLDNDKGFFMMVESGKIDWAGHANDAMSNINDTLAFDEAIQEAVEFYNEHPDETLIIVTGDHETGGMTLGQVTTGYNTAFDLLSHQTISYEAFDTIFKEFLKQHPGAHFEDAFEIISKNFGFKLSGDAKDPMVLNEYEINKLRAAYTETLKAKAERSKEVEAKILYGGYEPLTVTLTHILNNKAGIGWTSYSHTGIPVPVYAIGAGAHLFEGSYDNTDLYKKTVEAVGIK